MNLYAIRRRDFWGTAEELQATAARSAEVGEEMAADVRWIRTEVTLIADAVIVRPDPSPAA